MFSLFYFTWEIPGAYKSLLGFSVNTLFLHKLSTYLILFIATGDKLQMQAGKKRTIAFIMKYLYIISNGYDRMLLILVPLAPKASPESVPGIRNDKKSSEQNVGKNKKVGGKKLHQD